MKHSLESLLRPQSVAVIGASDNPARIGGRPIYSMLKDNFQGKLFPVNPNRNIVQGLQAYPNISSVPVPVDSAVISVPENVALQVIKECAESGVKSAVVFTSGYSNPEIEPDSGDIIYLENRAPIARAADQTENIKLIIEF